MNHPFHHIPPRDLSASPASPSEGEKEQFSHFHVNSPYSHRFPPLKRIQAFLIDAFHRTLPGLDLLPQRSHFLFGSLFFVVMFGLFLMLLLQGINNGRNTFLAPVIDNTVADNCQWLSASNTGVFYGTMDGHWQGTPKFHFSRGAIVLTVSSYRTDPDEYSGILYGVVQLLSYRGAIAVHQDLAKILLIWMTITFSSDATNAQRITLAGDPVRVFRREFQEASFGSDNSSCSTQEATSYDPKSSAVRAVFSASSCDAIVDAHSVSRLYDDEFRLKIDVRAIVTALSVNSDILSEVWNVVRVDELYRTYWVYGREYVATAFYDPRHPGMQPVFCFDRGQLPHTLCIIEVGGVPAFPFFHHLGQSKQIPAPCVCSSLSPTALSDKRHPCHAFSFLVGFYFWNSPDITPMFDALSKYASLMAFHDAGYSASFLSSSFGIASTNPIARNATIRHKAFDFCRTTNHSACSAFVVSLWDEHSTDYSISHYMLVLEKGACRDSFTPNVSSMYNFIQRPFAPLFQDYQKCQDDVQTLVLNQAGITFGNLQILAPLAGLFVLLLGMVCCTIKDRTDPEQQYDNVFDLHFTSTERLKALDAFAITLLLHRDRIMFDRITGREKRLKTGGEEEIHRLDRSMLREVVEDIVQHYNDADTRHQVLAFLAEQQKLSKMNEKNKKSGKVYKDTFSQTLNNRAHRKVAPQTNTHVLSIDTELATAKGEKEVMMRTFSSSASPRKGDDLRGPDFTEETEVDSRSV